MNSLQSVTLVGSFLSALMTTGCLGLLVPSGGDLPLAPNPPISETSQIQTILGSLTRGQQAYYLENGEFADTIEAIGIGISPGEGGYEVAIADRQPTQVILTATPERSGNPNFSAGVFIIETAGGPTTIAVQCESDTGMPMPRLEGEDTICEDAQ
ncbi:MAG: hypothetical protein F6K00_30265 [Leptolyngbya sp. SIOISBB]|nr:hypothetical protein [Leptolyngbya sp. SIOISBB]